MDVFWNVPKELLKLALKQDVN